MARGVVNNYECPRKVTKACLHFSVCIAVEINHIYGVLILPITIATCNSQGN